MNPTAEDILNKHYAARELDATNVSGNMKKTDAAIIAAMEEYSLLKSKEAASEAFDAGKRYGGKWTNEEDPFKNAIDGSSELGIALAREQTVRAELDFTRTLLEETKDKHEYVMGQFHVMCRAYEELKKELEATRKPL